MYRVNKRESAAAAVMAFLAFLQKREENHLEAPLLEALDILHQKLEASDTYRAKAAHILGAEIEAFDRWYGRLPKHRLDKVMGCVAVEYQILNGCEDKDAARWKVVGNDSAVANSLKDFRHNMEYNDTPKGAWKLFQWVVEQLKEFPVDIMADLTIKMYRERTGTGIVKRERVTKL